MTGTAMVAPIAVPRSGRDLRDPFAGEFAFRANAAADATSLVAVVNATGALEPVTIAVDVVSVKALHLSGPSRPRAPAARARVPRAPPLV
jgi:hypothetical protein